MNSRNIILSGALIALVMLVTTNVFFTSAATAYPQPGAFNPVGGIQVWEVKKDIVICDQAQLNGGSTPQGPNYEIGGCVDVTGPDSTSGNYSYVRSGTYLFTGETMNYLAVARDLNGAQFLQPIATLFIDGPTGHSVVCTDVTNVGYQDNVPWYGHDVSSLLAILPPQIGMIDKTGFNSTFDKLYSCTYTVQATDVDPVGKVTVQASDTSGNLATTLEEQWAFNPSISASVSFDSLVQSLAFPQTLPGTTVLSSNSLLIKNAGSSGVAIAVYLAGNDLYSSSGICPTTETLSINNVGYRCNVGSYFSEIWQPLPKIKQGAACGPSLDTRQCLVDLSAPIPGVIYQYNDLIPDISAKASDSVLGMGVTAQCTFKLNVPFPCVGSYSNPQAVEVLIRAV